MTVNSHTFADLVDHLSFTLIRSDQYRKDLADFHDNILHPMEYYDTRGYYKTGSLLLEMCFDGVPGMDQLIDLLFEINRSGLSDKEKTLYKKGLKGEFADRFISFYERQSKLDVSIPAFYTSLPISNKVNFIPFCSRKLAEQYGALQRQLDMK